MDHTFFQMDSSCVSQWVLYCTTCPFFLSLWFYCHSQGNVTYSWPHLSFSWRAIIDHLMTHDKTTFRDLMSEYSLSTKWGYPTVPILFLYRHHRADVFLSVVERNLLTFCICAARVAVAQSSSLSLFTNRDAELEQRAMLLKRLAFTIYSSEVDQYQKYLPDIQGTHIHWFQWEWWNMCFREN